MNTADVFDRLTLC